MLSHFCGPHHRNCSTISASPHFSLLVCRSLLWVVEILQVEVQSLLRVEPLVGDWRLELPVHLDADILDRTIARLRSVADFHRLGHCEGLKDTWERCKDVAPAGLPSSAKVA